ncbi:MAG: hypothetical protein IIV45_15675, partial [Lachnospiraceae bacterium]|nr:hypothetical protein [Lachnospiraceae bacterium]
MRKEMKKLLSYLLVAVLSVSTLVSSSITTEAVTLKNNREIVTVTTDAIEISQNEEGQTVYTLKDTVTNGLEIELSNGETVILDGMGNTILGKDAEGDNYTNADVALYVYGSGTLIIKDATLIGGNSDEKGNGARGVSVRNDVSIICQGNVQISAGNVR